MPTPIHLDSPVRIEGIGDAYGAALEAAGMRTILDMLRAGPAAVRQAAPRAPVAEVRRWFWAALLLQVDDVTPDLAEAFVAAGVCSVEQLADAGLRTLERAVRQAHDTHRLKDAPPSLYGLAGIQRAAAGLRGKGLAHGRILDAADTHPIEGAVVRAAGRKAVTDATGRFLLTRLPEGSVRLRVEAPGYLAAGARIDVRPREFHRTTSLRLAPSARPARPPVTEGGGKVIAWGRGHTVKLDTRDLADLPDGALLLVRRVMASGAVRLLGLRRTLAGRVIHVDRVDVARSALPPGTRIREVLRWTDRALTRTTLGQRDVARSVFESAFGPQTLEPKGRSIRPGPRERRATLDG